MKQKFSKPATRAFIVDPAKTEAFLNDKPPTSDDLLRRVERLSKRRADPKSRK